MGESGLAIFSALAITGDSLQASAGSGGARSALPTTFAGAAADFVMLTVLWGNSNPTAKPMAAAEFIFGLVTVDFPGSGNGCTLTTSDAPIIVQVSGATHVMIRRAGNVSESCILSVTPVSPA
jgi:hypothetical protein